jgi:hypothetical protein
MEEAPVRMFQPLLALALVVAAVCGYLIGGRHQAAPTSAADQLPSAARSITKAGLLVEYPFSWEAAAAPAIPGLLLAEATALVPAGEHSEGLLVGAAPAGSPAPLPAAFLTRLAGPPRTEVVALTATQALRYSDVDPRGYDGSLDIYAIPAVSGGARLLVCFARQRLTPTGQSCERTVTAVSPIGPQAPSLTPEPAYARQLSSVVDAMQKERSTARRKMAVSSSPALVSELAAGLSSELSSAARSVAALQPPPPAAAAEASLAEALRQAAHSYTALSYASTAESLSAYEAARDEVAAAERDVGTALENFTLLGYGAQPGS